MAQGKGYRGMRTSTFLVVKFTVRQGLASRETCQQHLGKKRHLMSCKCEEGNRAGEFEFFSNAERSGYVQDLT